MVCHTSAWKLAPQGFVVFLLKHYKPKTIYMNLFGNFEVKMGEGMNFLINERLHWTILNRDNLELPI